MNPITAVRWGGSAAVLLALVLWGRSCGVASAEASHRAEVDRKNTALERAGLALERAHDQLAAAAAALRSVSAETDAALERAAEKQRQADFAKERAEMAAADYKRQRDAIDAEMDRAKADPDCRRLLETTSCAALR